MSVIAIAAVDENWGIGFNGQLLEHIPADMKFFKECVENNISICGRKTFDTLPKRVFSQRQVIIISKDYSLPVCIPNTYNQYMGFGRCIFLLEQGMLEKTPDGKDIDIYIIGGASIYKQLLPYCDKAYITKIYKSHENVDSYFPNLDEMNDWKLIDASPMQLYNGINFQFTTYSRM